MSELREKIADELWRQVMEDFHKPLAPEAYGKTDRQLMLERADIILALVQAEEDE